MSPVFASPHPLLILRLKKKSETSTADKVQKQAHDVKTMTKDTMDSIESKVK
ncbi:hypothetical protein KY285_015801 [Solanum tuberosum]|nr:hypothetical protein KY285_015801 [Solanum tuberosum]